MDAAKFEKVVLMLSSDQPGEVFNAAQAIGRALPAAGLDWHKFAKLVAGRLGPKAKSEEPPPRTPYEDVVTDRYVRKDEISKVTFLLNMPSALTARERMFIEDLYNRIGRWGDRTMITGKQRSWLNAIWERVG